MDATSCCCDCVCKPGSVVNSHLSWQLVTETARCHLLRTRRASVLCPTTVLLQIGFTRQISLLISGELLPHLSILTENRRLFSVALSLESPPAAVSRYFCSVKPGLSSHKSFRNLLAAVQRTRSNIIKQKHLKVNCFIYFNINLKLYVKISSII